MTESARGPAEIGTRGARSGARHTKGTCLGVASLQPSSPEIAGLTLPSPSPPKFSLFYKSRVGCLAASDFWVLVGHGRVDKERRARASRTETARQRFFAAEGEKQAPTRRVGVGRERAPQVRLAV